MSWSLALTVFLFLVCFVGVSRIHARIRVYAKDRSLLTDANVMSQLTYVATTSRLPIQCCSAPGSRTAQNLARCSTVRPLASVKWCSMSEMYVLACALLPADTEPARAADNPWSPKVHAQGRLLAAARRRGRQRARGVCRCAVSPRYVRRDQARLTAPLRRRRCAQRGAV